MQNMQPWIKKYQPKKLSEIAGQDEAIKQLKDFINNFKKQKKKALLLYGPSGNGKTAAVIALANELNYEFLEINASDTRNQEIIESLVGSAIKQHSLFSKGKIILIDEIDGLSGMYDRGGAQALAKLIEKSSFPILMTANDPFDKKFKELRKNSTLVEFKELDYMDVFSVLEKICREEKIKFDEISLKSLARRAGGDLRAAINDLQNLCEKDKELKKEALEELSQREQKQSIVEALVRIFKTRDPQIAISALDTVDEDLDQVMLWMDENLPKEYKKPEDLARAYDYLSKADVFNRRIKRWQHWRFLVYINAFLTGGIAVSKDEKYKEFVQYTPTMRLLKLWQAKMKYMKRKAIAEKIAVKTHSSTSRVIKDTMPYIQAIFRKNKEMASKLADYFELDKEEVGWLKKQV